MRDSTRISLFDPIPLGVAGRTTTALVDGISRSLCHPPALIVLVPICPAHHLVAGRSMCPTSTKPLPWPLTWPTLLVRSPPSPSLGRRRVPESDRVGSRVALATVSWATSSWRDHRRRAWLSRPVPRCLCRLSLCAGTAASCATTVAAAVADVARRSPVIGAGGKLPRRRWRHDGAITLPRGDRRLSGAVGRDDRGVDSAHRLGVRYKPTSSRRRAQDRRAGATDGGRLVRQPPRRGRRSPPR